MANPEKLKTLIDKINWLYKSFEENDSFKTETSRQKFFELSVYPNPANELLNINVYGFIQSNDVMLITDLSGKELHRIKPSNRNQLDISGLSSGTYLINYLGNNNKTIKFTKQ